MHLEKLTVAQLVKTFHALYGTRRLSATFPTVRSRERSASLSVGPQNNSVVVKCWATEQLGCLAKHGNTERQKSCKSRVSSLKCWSTLPRTCRYCTTSSQFTSVVNIIATLPRSRDSETVLWKHLSLSCQHGNIAVSVYYLLKTYSVTR
jgi:hypothetical protein